jgi:uncharacterized protein
MPSPGAIVRDIHRLRRSVKDLTIRIDQGPKQLKAQHNKVARQEEILKKAQDELKHLKVKTHDRELSLKITTDQKTKYERQLNDIMSKKEYDALKHELATTREQFMRLEDEILAGMMEIEERQAKLPELEKALAQARADAAQVERDYQARMADLAGQRDRVMQELTQVEATLPEDFKPQYDRLIHSKAEDAMTAVTGKTCVACYTEITTQNYNDLVQGFFILCKSCGRMLYLAE